MAHPAELLTVATTDETRTFVGGPIHVGRDRRCEMVIEDDPIADVHLVVEAAGSAWSFRDVSAVGVWLDGEQVHSGQIETSAALRLGSPTGPRLEFETHARASPSPQTLTVEVPVVTGHDIRAAARQRPRAIAISALLVGLVTWLVHVGIMATTYGGSQSLMPAGEIVAGDGNRVWGTVAVLLWSVPIGILVGLLITSGWRVTGRTIADRYRFARAAYRAIDSEGRAAALMLAGSAGLLWIIITPRFASPDLLYRPGMFDTWGLMLSMYVLLAAGGLLGGGVAEGIGKVVQRLALRDAGTPVVVGSVVLSGLGIGLALPYLLSTTIIVVVVCVAFIAAGVFVRRRGRAVLAAATIMLGVMAPAALADDGGWAECGRSLTGYVGCDGSGAVYQDATLSVPGGALGGALGGMVAAAIAVLATPAVAPRMLRSIDVALPNEPRERRRPRLPPDVQVRVAPLQGAFLGHKVEEVGDEPTHTLRLEVHAEPPTTAIEELP